MGLFFALLFALLDTTSYLSQIYTKDDQERDARLGNVIDRHLIKEKEYKAGRNMYLVGFALTLLFVIGRITELMQEHAELEGRIENLRLAVSIQEKHASEEAVNSSTIAAAKTGVEEVSGEGIEMKPIQHKKKD